MPNLSKYKPSKEDCALIVIDIQDRLVKVMEKDAMKEVIENTQRLIQSAHILDIPVVFTQQYTKGLGETVPELEIRDEVDSKIEKLSFSCCPQDEFKDVLTKLNRKSLIIAGLETHICVLQTVIDLLEDDYNVHVISDAVISRKKENKQIGLDLMCSGGAIISSTETILFQLLKKAGTPEFKQISKLV